MANICYKVARKIITTEGTEYASTFVYSPRRRAIYRVGQVTKSPIKGTPLFVFRSIENMQAFNVNDGNYVLECEYDHEYGCQAPMYNIDPDRKTLTFIQNYWKEVQAGIHHHREDSDGVLLVKSVKVIRLIGVITVNFQNSIPFITISDAK